MKAHNVLKEQAPNVDGFEFLKGSSQEITESA